MAIFPTGEDEDQESSDGDVGAYESFRRDYGWYYVVDQMVRDTPNVNEDQILEWSPRRFLGRLQYLIHKGQVELFIQQMKQE